MLEDVRIRSSNRPTKVPRNYRAFVYSWFGVDSNEVKVILASDKIRADQLLRDFCNEQGINNSFFRYLGEDDFSLVADSSDLQDVLF